MGSDRADNSEYDLSGVDLQAGDFIGDPLDDDEYQAIFDNARQDCLRSAPVGGRRRQKKAAYVVYRGRQTGIFQTWCVFFSNLIPILAPQRTPFTGLPL